MSPRSGWRKKIEDGFLLITQPLCRVLAARRVHPNFVSAAGFILSLVAGVLYAIGEFFQGGVAVLLAGACDAIDGRLARQTGRGSRFGAVIDSTLDRFGEIFTFSGLLWYFSGADFPGSMRADPNPLMMLLTLLALTGSLMVSYIRARAEGVGVKCDVGLMQRPERMFVLIIGSLISVFPVVGSMAIKFSIGFLALLTNHTVLSRIHFVYRELSAKENSTDHFKNAG